MTYEVDIQTIVMLMVIACFIGFVMGVAVNKPVK